MITEPLDSVDQLEIRNVVAKVGADIFSIEDVCAAARSALGYDDMARKTLVDLGWFGSLISEDHGGSELGAIVQCLIHRELGARLAPSPYLATAGYAALALRLLGDPRNSAAHLRRIATGEATYAVAPMSGWPETASPRVEAALDGETWVLSGEVALVPDAARADRLLLVASTGSGSDGWRLFEVMRPARGLVVEPILTIDATRSFGRISLRRVKATPLSDVDVSTAQTATFIDAASVLLAAELVGTATRAFRVTLEYLATRLQFGKPIGSFQALKHRCAGHGVGITMAQELVFSAAWLIDDANWAGLEIAAPLALARAGEVAKAVTEDAIQLHGGIGFTEEAHIGMYYRRVLVDLETTATLADTFAHLDRVRPTASDRG